MLVTTLLAAWQHRNVGGARVRVGGAFMATTIVGQGDIGATAGP
ncbi:MAG: hypothetical protein ACREDR_15780 [Blastocatellia bacterium]